MPSDNDLPAPDQQTELADIDWSKIELAPADEVLDDTAEGDLLPYEGRDRVLHFFNQLAIDGLRLGITLYVKGVTVSGTLIPAFQYVAELRRPFEAGGSDSWAAYIREALDDMISLDERLRQKDDYSDELNFVHLMDAKTFAPGALGMPSNGQLMRIKVDSIDGWAHGLLEKTPA